MYTTLIFLNQNFFTQASNRFSEGGPFFMSVILFCLIAAMVFLIIGFLNLKNDPEKTRKMAALASEVSILGLVVGLLASIIGMIEAFDAIENINDNTLGAMANGLKISFITTLFGSITFIIPRIGIIILKTLQ